ncbi:hypothetical protein LJK87_27395 [Paenibacillus sp. P25]|nr:hypothetical protein LJK87_27395 [Paenibacillus sp. P25]
MPNRTDSDQAASLKLFVVLSKAYKTIMERAERDMKQYGMSPTEFTILEVLYTKGRIPLQQIGEKILITSGKDNVQYRQAGEERVAEAGALRRRPKGHLRGDHRGRECAVRPHLSEPRRQDRFLNAFAD